MKYVYFDASSGASGDMILGAFLDLGISPSVFKTKMAELGLPAEIKVKETTRASLRGLKVDVKVQRKKKITRKWADVLSLLKKSSFSPEVKKQAQDIFKRLFEAEARVHRRKFEEALGWYRCALEVNGLREDVHRGVIRCYLKKVSDNSNSLTLKGLA